VISLVCLVDGRELQANPPRGGAPIEAEFDVHRPRRRLSCSSNEFSMRLVASCQEFVEVM
jgi:hypothetical protein